MYLASKMSELPKSYRLVLKLASCLGHQFDGATFNKAKVSYLFCVCGDDISIRHPLQCSHSNFVSTICKQVKSDYKLENVLPLVCNIGYIHEISPNEFIW